MTTFEFPPAVLSRLALCDRTADEIAACAADTAWGALKAGWGTYDLGRGRPLTVTADKVRSAVADTIRAMPARPQGDFVDAIAQQGLASLGWQYDAARQIVTGPTR